MCLLIIYELSTELFYLFFFFVLKQSDESWLAFASNIETNDRISYAVFFYLHCYSLSLVTPPSIQNVWHVIIQQNLWFRKASFVLCECVMPRKKIVNFTRATFHMHTYTDKTVECIRYDEANKTIYLNGIKIHFWNCKMKSKLKIGGGVKARTNCRIEKRKASE